VTKLAHDGLQVSLHPGCAQGQGKGQRSRDTGTFLMAQIAFLLAGKLDPKPAKIRSIRQICSCSQNAAEKSSAKPNISQILMKN